MTENTTSASLHTRGTTCGSATGRCVWPSFEVASTYLGWSSTGATQHRIHSLNREKVAKTRNPLHLSHDLVLNSAHRKLCNFEVHSTIRQHQTIQMPATPRCLAVKILCTFDCPKPIPVRLCGIHTIPGRRIRHDRDNSLNEPELSCGFLNFRSDHERMFAYEKCGCCKY